MSQHMLIEVFEQSGEYGYTLDGADCAYGFKTEVGAKSAARSLHRHYIPIGQRLKWNKGPIGNDKHSEGRTVVAFTYLGRKP